MPSSFEDVYDMQRAVEDKTLVWVDSSNREAGGTRDHYTVKLTEPIHNVVGIRVIEASIPATVQSIEHHNDLLVLHTVYYDDYLPVSPLCVLQTHSKGFQGEAWRVHDRSYAGMTPPGPVKTPFFDINQNAEHHVASVEVAICSAMSYRLANIIDATIAGSQDYVLCVFDGDVSKRFDEGQSEDAPYVKFMQERSVYDLENNKTMVSCAFSSDLMTKDSTTISIIAGLYQIPHGKYDSLRDFTTEVQHGYTATKQGVQLDFIEAQTSKPERSFMLQINPKKVWIDVSYGADDGRYTHVYPPLPHAWCAIWAGSSCLRALGFMLPETDTTRVHETAGGTFFVSDPDLVRYQGRLRANDWVDLSSERYVWLRCDELEQHMCSGVGRILQRGIGVFKLDTPSVLWTERTEFISVIPSHFHPIGKLHQLTLKFETGRGVPYDFKNLEHFILMSVVSLKANKDVVYQHLPRLLNPDYEPNALMYQLKWDRGCSATSGGNQALSAEDERRVVRIHNAALRGVELM